MISATSIGDITVVYHYVSSSPLEHEASYLYTEIDFLRKLLLECERKLPQKSKLKIKITNYFNQL